MSRSPIGLLGGARSTCNTFSLGVRSELLEDGPGGGKRPLEEAECLVRYVKSLNLKCILLQRSLTHSRVAANVLKGGMAKSGHFFHSFQLL